MIVERTHYFAKPGKAAETLAIRRRASRIRRELGLASGSIFTGAGAGTPDVIWECTFHDAASHEADLAARAASADFTAIRGEMRAVIDDFQRHVMARDDEPIDNGMRPVDLTGLDIVPREISFPSDGRQLKGYFFAPPGKGPFPCMISNHGSGIDKGTLDVSRPGTAALLMSWGIASFLPHRRGYGNSPGHSWRDEVPAPHGTEDYDRDLVARLGKESDDVLAALDCVAALPEVDKRHIGVIGSSFGGINTLLAASRTDRFTCAVEFAGAAMNWPRTPRLREFMTEAAHRVAMPLFLVQAANDYSIRPTLELAESLKDTGRVVWSKIFPSFGINEMEGHLLESRGSQLWAEDVHRFLERYL
jgi:dienelactone hydrolase